jgi:hypothetical protein
MRTFPNLKSIVFCAVRHAFTDVSALLAYGLLDYVPDSYSLKMKATHSAETSVGFCGTVCTRSYGVSAKSGNLVAEVRTSDPARPYYFLLNVSSC